MFVHHGYKLYFTENSFLLLKLFNNFEIMYVFALFFLKNFQNFFLSCPCIGVYGGNFPAYCDRNIRNREVVTNAKVWQVQYVAINVTFLKLNWDRVRKGRYLSEKHLY